MAFNNTERQEPMKDKQSYFTYQQIQRMLDNAPNKKVWLLVYMLSRTGRRINELLGLQPKHIDQDKQLIMWWILKKKYKQDAKGKPTWKPIDTKTLKVLQDFIYKFNLREDDYFFKSDRKTKEGLPAPYTRKWAYDCIKNLTEKCQIRFTGQKELKPYERPGKNGEMVTIYPKAGWHPHHFRHSYSIHFLSTSKNPGALKLLQQQLDHSSLTITSGYLEFAPKEQIKALDDVFGGDEND